MLDLRTLQDKTFSIIWTDGTTIKIPAPTIYLLRRIERTNDTVAELTPIVTDILNGNEATRTFTEQEIESLNIEQLRAIVQAVYQFKQDADNTPN